MNDFLTIEVAFASSEKQKVITLTVKKGTTVREAILASGIQQIFPEIDLTRLKVGIYGKQCELSHFVELGDRIEIYRPLKIDPKEARRAKAKKQKT